MLASILAWRRAHADVDPDDVILVADDISLRNKARARGIPVVPLDESFRLRDEPTEEERELARVKRELEKYTTRQPKLALEFEVNGQHGSKLVTELDILGEITPDELDSLVEAEGKAIAPSVVPLEVEDMPSEMKSDKPLTLADIESLMEELPDDVTSEAPRYVPKVELLRFEKEKKKYLGEYRAYLKELYAWYRASNLVVALKPTLLNTGTLQAENLVLEVHIPAALGIRDADDLPERPEKPSSPIPPRTAVELLVDVPKIPKLDMGWFHGTLEQNQPRAVDERVPIFVSQPFRGPVWHITKLVHHQPARLHPIYIASPAVVGEVEYTIQYRITASELLEPVTGTLTLEVRGMSRKFADYVRGDGPASSSEDTDARTTGP